MKRNNPDKIEVKDNVADDIDVLYEIIKHNNRIQDIENDNIMQDMYKKIIVNIDYKSEFIDDIENYIPNPTTEYYKVRLYEILKEKYRQIVAHGIDDTFENFCLYELKHGSCNRFVNS